MTNAGDYVRPAGIRGGVVLTGVTVVDVAGGTATAGRDVRIADGRIASIGAPDPAVPGPRHDAAGRFLVPGFVDAHVHVLNQLDTAPASYALMLANGITGFRQLSGSPELLAARRAGTLPAPPGAPELLALPGAVLTPANAAGPERAAAEVRAQRDQGADFVKAVMTQHDSFLAALAEARRIGLPLAGHLPEAVAAADAARGGIRCIEHLGPGPALYEAAAGREPRPDRVVARPEDAGPDTDRNFELILRTLVTNPFALFSATDADRLARADAEFDADRAAELAALFVANGTWHCPTLIRLHTMQFPDAPEHATDPRLTYVTPASIVRWRRANHQFAALPAPIRATLREHWTAQLRMTALLAAAGAPLLAGTDAGGSGWVIPGFALHDEFDLLASAGLDPLTILRMTTSAPARFHGRDDAGDVRPGHRADLVLLRQDPLADHRALHAIEAVVRGGDLWSRPELDQILRRAARTPAAG